MTRRGTARHLRRPRLIGPLVEAPIVVLEAGGGAGKTSLALELAETLDLAPVVVRIEPGADHLDHLRSRLGDALRRVGFRRAAAAAGAAESPAALVGALDRIDTGVLLVLDEVQELEPPLSSQLGDLVAGTAGRPRLVLCGRRVPVAVPADGTVLTDAELALRPEEVVELSRLVRGEDHDAEAARAVHAVTAGWVAPTLASLVAGHDSARGAMRTVRSIVEGILGRLDHEDRLRLGQLAHLPRFDESVVAAMGATTALEAGQDAGLLLRRFGGWAVLANPFRDELADAVPFEQVARERGAAALAESGDVLLAAQLLRRHDGDTAAAALLAGQQQDHLLRWHGTELLGFIEELADDAVRTHPQVLLIGSAMAAVLAQPVDRRAMVGRLLQVADEEPVRDLARAECLLERVWRHPQPAELRQEVADLRRARSRDPEVDARLTEVDARLAALSESERDDGDDLDLAWAQAVTAWERAGHWLQAAHASVWRALQGAWEQGRFDAALEHVTRALELGRAAPATRLLALCFRGMFLVDVGRYAEANHTLEEAAGLAHALRADVRRAHVEWFRARMASQQGDAERTLTAVRAAEDAAVNDAGGGVFFAADAATLLARVGLDEEAQSRLDHAVAHDPGNSEKVPLAAMDVAARQGDLEGALEWHERMQEHYTEPRDRWRHRLLLAWAAHCCGDERSSAWAVESFEGAAALGHPDLPFVREPAVARDLVHAAARAGSTAATQLLDSGIATVRILGGFAVELPGALDPAVGGKEAGVVKYLAVVGGRARSGAVIEALWADGVAERGSARLRVVLSRLRAQVGVVVVRDGDVLAFAAGVAVDAVRFDDLAQRALLGDDIALVEAAIAAYGGDVLPDDIEEPWINEARDRLRWRYLALVDRLAAAVERDGDLERALSLLHIGIDAEPLVEDRYLLAARLLCEQSRLGRARALLERAVRRLEREGIRPMRDLLALLDMLRR